MERSWKSKGLLGIHDRILVQMAAGHVAAEAGAELRGRTGLARIMTHAPEFGGN